MRIFSLYTTILAAFAVGTSVSCTSQSDDSTQINPFADIEWPDSLIPTGAEAGSMLAFTDGSNFPTIYPNTYYDSGPGEVVFTFDGDTTGGQVTATGLPVLSEDNGVPFDDERRQATSTWTQPSSSSTNLGPFSLVFSLPGINGGIAERSYEFQNLTMQFTSINVQGDIVTYRGVFASGVFLLAVGPSYGDNNPAEGNEDSVLEMTVAGNPFIYTTTLAPEPEPEPEPEPAP